jgi:hypothetical protein
MLGLDDILPGLWDDSHGNGRHSKYGASKVETFRVIHNWEMPIWWYRKIGLTEKGVAVDDLGRGRCYGGVFTIRITGVGDRQTVGAFLNVYPARSHSRRR